MFTELRDKLLLALTDTTSWKNLVEDCLNKNYLNKEEIEEIKRIENFIRKTMTMCNQKDDDTDSQTD
jgi:hypothetical protein